jgi:hypothetical protein
VVPASDVLLQLTGCSNSEGGAGGTTSRRALLGVEDAVPFPSSRPLGGGGARTRIGAGVVEPFAEWCVPPVGFTLRRNEPLETVVEEVASASKLRLESAEEWDR